MCLPRGEVVKQYRPHLLVLCVLAAFLLTGMHNALRNALTDARFNWFPRQASGDIVLVAINSPSLQTVGVWPWPRQIHAQLIDKLESAGASDIAFDIDFSSPSNPASDQAFADALQRAGGSVVLASFKQLVASSGQGTTLHVNRPLPQFSKHAWSAIVNVVAETGRAGSSLSVRGYVGRKVSAVPGCDAGGTIRNDGCTASDRFQHSRQFRSDGVLRGCLARRLPPR